MRVPGFRAGKVPGDVVLRQVGREAVMDKAVRRGLPSWYEAMADAEITPVSVKLDLEDLPAKGAPLAFTIEVGVVPPAQLGDYLGPRGRPARAKRRRTRCRRSSSACANRWPRSRPSSARRPQATWLWTSTARSTVRSSRAARPAAT